MILTTNIENLLGEANTSKTKAKYTSFPKTVTGPSNNNDSVQAIYEVSEHKFRYGKNTITTPTAAQQIKFDEDKKEIKWAFRIDNSLMNNKKEYILISERSLMAESDTDFTQETNRTLFKDAVAEKGYLQATIDPITRKLTITFSKWLDGMKVYVEAFRNNPDSKIKTPLQTYIKETNIKASPEIIDSYWLNSQGKKVIATGFETSIQLYIETLGLMNEGISLRLFDSDVVFDDPLLWDGQTSYDCIIDNRKFSVPYNVKPANSPDYANGQSWFEGNLEVFVNISFDNTALPITIADSYAEINFTPDKKANLYLAKKEEVFVNNILYTQYNKIESVYPGMTAYLVVETANLNGTVTFSITEETPLLVLSGIKLPLLIGTNSQTDFSATVVDDFAVVQVKFQEVNSTMYNSWNASLDDESEEGLFSKLQIKASIGVDEYNSNSELKLKSSVIRYIIKTDGITKHHRDVSRQACFIFKENSGTLHYLTKVDFIEINQHSRNYTFTKSKAQLVDIRDVTNYNSGFVKYKFEKINVSKKNPITDSRYWIDIDSLACLIAAMIEVGIEDLRFNGASNSKGYPSPSVSHWNGLIFDLGYFSINSDASKILLYTNSTTKLRNPDFDYNRQVLFNNALYKYGYSKYRKNDSSVSKSNKTMLTEKFKLTSSDTEFTTLPHAIHKRYTTSGGKTVRHDNHLHVSGLDISFFKLIKS